jgi:hypothetical protein
MLLKSSEVTGLSHQAIAMYLTLHWSTERSCYEKEISRIFWICFKSYPLIQNISELQITFHSLCRIHHSMQHTFLPPQNRRSNAMLPPCSVMLIRSVTFVWVSQMAFLPPSSPTPYPSPYPHHRPWSVPLHFPPSPFSLWSQTPLAEERGCFKLKGEGAWSRMLRGAGGGFCRPWPLTGSCLQPPCSFHLRQPYDHLTVAKVAWQSACPRAPAQPFADDHFH